MQFINKELNRINELLSKNSNNNIIYFQKTTKFVKNKYNYEYNLENKLPKIVAVKKKIFTKEWIKKKFYNWRYNEFITLFYFSFSLYIKGNEDKSVNQLKDLNNLIVKLREENDKNYKDIIIYLQKINKILIKSS